MRCINGKQFLYWYTSFVSHRNERKYRLISLLTRSTTAFSCLEYASVRLWGVPVDTRSCLIESLAKCEPRSDLIIWGVEEGKVLKKAIGSRFGRIVSTPK